MIPSLRGDDPLAGAIIACADRRKRPRGATCGPIEREPSCAIPAWPVQDVSSGWSIWTHTIAVPAALAIEMVLEFGCFAPTMQPSAHNARWSACTAVSSASSSRVPKPDRITADYWNLVGGRPRRRTRQCDGAERSERATVSGWRLHDGWPPHCGMRRPGIERNPASTKTGELVMRPGVDLHACSGPADSPLRLQQVDEDKGGAGP